MTSDKKNISLLTDLFVRSGLSNIVISPGSRNAPIIISFANRKGIKAFSIVDERSAAFFALGIALNTQKTTAIACTSGSAVLNYASAISEAFYQKLPLLILTADRPSNLIDIGDGQTIRQNNVFANYVKKSYQLPLNIDTEDEFKSAKIIINEALYECNNPQPGPVHINIPFDEPIYGTTEEQITGNLIDNNKKPIVISQNKIKEIAKKFSESEKIMIIVGQMRPDSKLSNILSKLSERSNTIVLTETTSNVFNGAFIDTIDNVVSTIDNKDIESFKPEIVISFGGQVVSKMIKKFLRNNKPNKHWHISPSGEKMDTYFSLTEALETDEVTFLNSLEKKLVPINSNFKNIWLDRRNRIDVRKSEYLSKCEYSDLNVFDVILSNLPKDSILHLGNSTPVRYSQLFGSKENIEYNSNRGVSGIDGQISTAAGYTYYSSKLNVLITGDLGFFYDSNGLMNKYLSPNLKIIVINNSGGGIFRFIPGPDTTPNLEEFFEAKHRYKAEFICKAFDVDYIKAHTLDDLKTILPNFMNKKMVLP
ncbi:MAG: 2-succinyl-5-enolpyruvyl-6-hydroxy-3-cyclohexene-1-carboxylic-acid synthase [Bacteroidetes bacterium]|nr:2-succinyl-5-enolpyruvyl-6-hydroxy-3-cyclohexene-1-carboxylic-acid synthase [Bacteroidota bacterium]